jgi:hypothetical protein
MRHSRVSIACQTLHLSSDRQNLRVWSPFIAWGFVAIFQFLGGKEGISSVMNFPLKYACEIALHFLGTFAYLNFRVSPMAL